MQIHLNTQFNTGLFTSKSTAKIHHTVKKNKKQRKTCHTIPRIPHGRWLSCSVRPEQRRRRRPRPKAPLPSSSAEPQVPDPHRCVRQNWPSRLGTWWVSAGPVSYLALRERETEKQREREEVFILPEARLYTGQNVTHVCFTSRQGLLHLDRTERSIVRRRQDAQVVRVEGDPQKRSHGDKFQGSPAVTTRNSQRVFFKSSYTMEKTSI